MKYLSTIIFLAAMYWTWALVNNVPAVSEQVHVDLQNSLKSFIGEQLQAAYPNMANLSFDKFWTETIDADKVKVTFIFSYDDANDQVGEIRSRREGYTVMRRVTETVDQTDWDFQDGEIVILSDQVEFKEPLKITPAASESAEPAGN
jgi:hypothetical protein